MKQKYNIQKKCESCFKQKSFNIYTLPWSPYTHWMYNSDIKRCVLYLLLVGKHPDNIFSRLGKDIWKLIIKHTISPYFYSCRRKPSIYCNDCTPKIFRKPECQWCIKEFVKASITSPACTYKIENNELIEIPAICKKCSDRIYICELHNMQLHELCVRCTNPRKLTDSFNSISWKYGN